MCLRRGPRVGAVAHAIENLGGQHHLLALGELPQGLAGDLFAGAEGIDVGRVEEVDAGLDGPAKKGMAAASSRTHGRQCGSP